MTFIVVPHQVGKATATIWVGAVDEQDLRRNPASIELDDGTEKIVCELDLSRWQRWVSYNPGDEEGYPALDRLLHRLLPKLEPVVRTLDYQRATVGGLKPNTPYSVKLGTENEAPIGADKQLREGSFKTLPAALPGESSKPFTVLLGSCFYGPKDRRGLVGATYHHLPEDRRPDIKILCGDQVYLDNPWFDTSFRYNGGNSKPGLFRAGLFQKYLNNWKQVEGDDAGFRQLLKDGANYFCSDDHEFWNNAPNFGGIGFVNTLSKGQRCWWHKAARELFEAFQSPQALMCFDVAMPSGEDHRLSFCVADTRINRTANSDRFMNAEHFEALKRWIEQLRGPGVLVVGQPVLIGKTNSPASSLGEEPTKTAWSFLDKNLANYEAQYEELVEHINNAAHSVVVLTGDVHFGRVACSKPTQGSDDAAFVEVISSPMQLVVAKIKLFERAKGLPGHYRDAPKQPFAITESRPLAPGKNHFVTVEFSYRNGGKVLMVVRSWPILESGQDLPPSPEQTFEAVLG
jgi:hypothetical protein